MSHNAPDLKELKAIVDWVGVTEDVREFSLKFGDVELFVSRNQQLSPQPSSVTIMPATPTPPAPLPSSNGAAAAPIAKPTATLDVKPSPVGDLAVDEVLIKAPMVGTFYASPKPGAAAFVKPGDAVKPDTVLCIVEVMKLMNNIEAGVAGIVTKILVENEQAVEYGQPLIVIKRSA